MAIEEVNFKAEIFAIELLCDRCENYEECPFDGTDDGDACETYITVKKLID
ncbi:hypothetical protein LCGC14_2287350 [marine sediment metagenome]|uniref:Uncharacterized protein n=1 Tax=marine sediment metagenome TaxID=412755 RepID=A0A0F9FMJ7_9ZZZZ